MVVRSYVQVCIGRLSILLRRIIAENKPTWLISASFWFPFFCFAGANQRYPVSCRYDDTAAPFVASTIDGDKSHGHGHGDGDGASVRIQTRRASLAWSSPSPLARPAGTHEDEATTYSRASTIAIRSSTITIQPCRVDRGRTYSSRACVPRLHSVAGPRSRGSQKSTPTCARECAAATLPAGAHGRHQSACVRRPARIEPRPRPPWSPPPSSSRATSGAAGRALAVIARSSRLRQRRVPGCGGRAARALAPGVERARGAKTCACAPVSRRARVGQATSHLGTGHNYRCALRSEGGCDSRKFNSFLLATWQV